MITEMESYISDGILTVVQAVFAQTPNCLDSTPIPPTITPPKFNASQKNRCCSVIVIRRFQRKSLNAQNMNTSRHMDFFTEDSISMGHFLSSLGKEST